MMRACARYLFPRNTRTTRQRRDGKREEMPPNRRNSLLTNENITALKPAHFVFNSTQELIKMNEESVNN